MCCKYMLNISKTKTILYIWSIVLGLLLLLVFLCFVLVFFVFREMGGLGLFLIFFNFFYLLLLLLFYIILMTNKVFSVIFNMQISHSIQCSTTGVTKVMVCTLLTVVHITDPLLQIEKNNSSSGRIVHATACYSSFQMVGMRNI